jgi:hypothetical protein
MNISNIAEYIFPVTAAVLVIVDILLILAVRKLTASIKKLNVQTQEKFNILVNEINKKFKSIIDVACVAFLNKEKKK